MLSLKDRIAAFQPKVAGNASAMLALAEMLLSDGQGGEALALCRAAQALAPHDKRLAARARALVNGTVRRWHFTIVNDAARNDAYEAALRRAVEPSSRILEIGTGTGLLAMMAARAGAAAVTTCEAVPAIAEKAAEIVAANGYADRVRVVAKHSDALDPETDMGGRADILVSEIVSSNLLSEDVLPAHERAVRDLLRPGARVIPARGTIRVALAWCDEDALGPVSGFDLSAFNGLRRPIRRLRSDTTRLSLRSDAADLFVFDFASPRYCAPARAALTCRSRGGGVNGVAQWIALDLDEATRYENRPEPGRQSAWAVLFHAFPEAIATVPDQQLGIAGAHNRKNLTIWLDNP